jgi:hypothetical protein
MKKINFHFLFTPMVKINFKWFVTQLQKVAYNFFYQGKSVGVSIATPNGSRPEGKTLAH